MEKLSYVSTKVEENIKYLKGRFANAMDFLVREMDLNGTRAALFSLDGLVSKQTITLSVLNPIMHAPVLPGDGEMIMKFVEESVLGAVEQKHETELDTIETLLMSGFAILCIEGCPYVLSFGVQGFQSRGPDEPQNEVMQRGAKDGFTESFQTNISLIRRRMKTTALKFEKHTVGTQSRTPVVLCYLEGIASEKILRQLREKLKACNLKTTLAAGYLTGYLERGGIFSGVGVSERPDTVCGKIEEGRVAVLVEGTPGVLLVPFLFVENFQTIDDYLTRPYYATFIRWIKYLAFFISIFLPGMYVAIATHHPEMLPESLLLKIAEEQAKTPFPVMVESMLLYFMYEIMREAGLRAPRALSTTVSIVGGLVIGETAVSAGLVSAPSLMVIALTAISGYVVPRLYEPLALMRFLFILIGNFIGLWGVMVGMVFLLMNLCGESAFGVPLLSPVSPLNPRLAMRDVFARAGWNRLSEWDAKVQDMPGSSEIGQS